jgi:UDP-N-acetylglucosamine/UDP-N-acetylgalactosamine diphosphorylase
MYCVDNALVRVADPKFIGACIGAGTDCAAKTILKTDPTEPVGIFCRRKDGKLIVGEYSELDSHVASQVDKDGKLIYNQANIANHFFTVDFLEKISKGKSLSMHLAHKKIPTVGGETMMGFKMEAFIFDVFEWAEKPVVYQGERWEEFAPLKNASGAKTDSPECCRKMLLDLHAKWLTKAGAKIEGAVEISPLISYAGEGLEKWKGKTVTGNLKDL